MGDVVDIRFRVKCVKDLWVVDASVLNAAPVSEGPMPAVYMLVHLPTERIAERTGACDLKRLIKFVLVFYWKNV